MKLSKIEKVKIRRQFIERSKIFCYLNSEPMKNFKYYFISLRQEERILTLIRTRKIKQSFLINGVIIPLKDYDPQKFLKPLPTSDIRHYVSDSETKDINYINDCVTKWYLNLTKNKF